MLATSLGHEAGVPSSREMGTVWALPWALPSGHPAVRPSPVCLRIAGCGVRGCMSLPFLNLSLYVLKSKMGMLCGPVVRRVTFCRSEITHGVRAAATVTFSI